MANVDKLMAMGAECVGGTLLLKNKVLGNLRDGDLQLTEDGLAMLEIDDAVEVVRPAAKTAKAPKEPKAPKATKAAEPETPPADAPDGELDLGDLSVDE